MPALQSKIYATGKASQRNRARMLALLERLRSLEARTRHASARAKPLFDKRGQLLPRERIARLHRSRRALARTLLDGRLLPRRSRPGEDHPRRRHGVRHRLRLGRARDGGAEQAALTMAIVMEAGMKRKGQDVDHHQIDAMKAKIVENFERQQSALVTSALMLDDGIIDPRDTRNVLGFALSICKDGDARTLRPVQFGVARP
jgi:acetyl-CoA carboxylase carboxyltransferase component